MTRGLNKVQIIGHLGRDPEMRYTPSGRSVTTFTVAVSRQWNTGDGERHTETEWFNVVAWGNLAEICKQYLNKGQQVYVEGRLQTRRWDDKEGVKHVSVEVVANEMMMVGDRADRRDQNNQAPHPMEGAPNENEMTTNEDEFPF
ncbi:MAG: single-stranded DNA-binding protein [Anaerolineae bacterium]|nr:single-stranded DNA-binding protein [Anaerolineae bacterium]MCI0610886.1 single-stranded DNA-binding protein [Anaerolineae bacterium]